MKSSDISINSAIATAPFEPQSADARDAYSIGPPEAPPQNMKESAKKRRSRFVTRTMRTLTGLAENLYSPESPEAVQVVQKQVGKFNKVAEQPEWSGSGTSGRKLTLTPLSDIPMRATHWLWEGRLALGSFALLAGREGVGKSTVAYTLAAQVTQGTLEGRYFGDPHSVIIAATEDSFAHTIVPRLKAAEADLTKVFRADVQADGILKGIDLPADLKALEAMVKKDDVALILIDPLTSRLSETLDMYKDSDVRQALEPIVSMADRTDCIALGIIHVNKSAGTDAGNLIMGSRAFNAVARSTMMAMVSPEDPELRILAMAKNNLGRADLEALTYRIEGTCLGDDAQGDRVWTGHLEWVGTDPRHISELIEAASHGSTKKSALDETIEWLEEYLSDDKVHTSKEVEEAAKAAGHRGSLRRAKEALEVETVRVPGVYPPQYELRFPDQD